jgi:spore germination protein YaaH
MAYDQQRADVKLNEQKAGEPYFPVSDADWVRKVVAFSVESLPKEKIMLGIPTYGYEYEITVSPNWFRTYVRVSSPNLPAALKLAKKEKITPSRNRGGEWSFTYATKHTAKAAQSKSLDIPKGTSSGNLVAARALAYATKTGNDTLIRYVTVSDFEAIQAKVDIAQEFGLRGVVFFKFDGEGDEKLWSLFE